MDKNQFLKQSPLAGKFWFSKRQWEEARDKKRFRTFARLINGKITEYTEMVDDEVLTEDPNAECLYPDAVYLGLGVFDHFGEIL